MLRGMRQENAWIGRGQVWWLAAAETQRMRWLPMLAVLLASGVAPTGGQVTQETVRHPNVQRYREGTAEFSAYTDANGERVYHGSCKSWYGSGQISMEANYDHGKRHGDYVEWDPDGKMARRCKYSCGQYDGPFEEWHENGTKATAGFYSKGTAVGLWIRWNDNATKRFEVYNDIRGNALLEIDWQSTPGFRRDTVNTWQDGEKTRQTARWYGPDGALAAQGVYKEGRPWDGSFFEDDTILALSCGEGKVWYSKGRRWEGTWRFQFGPLDDSFTRERVFRGTYRQGKPWMGTFVELVVAPGKTGAHVYLAKSYEEGELVSQQTYTVPVRDRPTKTQALDTIEALFKDGE